jgi:hypothetical protein
MLEHHADAGADRAWLSGICVGVPPTKISPASAW